MTHRCRALLPPPAMRRILAQHFIDTRLPAASLLPECLQHVPVEPQRLVELPVRFLGSAAVAAHQLLRRIFSDRFRQHFRRRPRPGEIVLVHSGLSSSVREARSLFVFFLYRLTSGLFALRKLMTCKSSLRGVTTAACRRPSSRTIIDVAELITLQLDMAEAIDFEFNDYRPS
jgi:hypothetical protein